MKETLTQQEIELLAQYNVKPEDFEPASATYGGRVDSMIRKRYSLSEELAILRQRETKPAEFAEYDAYCEECKARAKAEINIH